jgi:excinuclease ABC subunit A
VGGYDPNFISVSGAREHNLQSVSLTIPKNRLICFTGVSGSGKSSLAFDTLYAEGQRRYIESLSSYARQFLGQLPKPNVDQISGLAPAISIQQKTSGWNPRSTVGTVTQIHDYLRVLYARAGTQHCVRCGRPISAQSREQMLARVLSLPEGSRRLLLAPKVRAQKGEYRDLFDELLRQGFVRARVDGELIELADPPALDRYRRHDIDVVIDRLVINTAARARIAESLELALKVGDGVAVIAPPDGGAPEPVPTPVRRRSRRAKPDTAPDAAALKPAAAGEFVLSAASACIECGLGYEPLSPQSFSFNSPQGMCPQCDGLGSRFDFEPALLIPDDRLSFLHPCIAPMRRPPGRWRRHIYDGVARHFGGDLTRPWRELPLATRRALLHGAGDEHIMFEWRTRRGIWRHGGAFDGVIAELQAAYRSSSSSMVRSYYEQFMRQGDCPACRGARLMPQALAVTLRGRLAAGRTAAQSLNLAEFCRLPITAALEFLDRLELDDVRRIIAHEPLKEICARLRFLIDVGLGYLTLDRAAPTLSGGESQRIRLASQIGCGLVGVLYVLDEPSIGLHPRDNRRLLDSLKRLRDMGNTVVVVEHDRDTMEAADVLVDFGPGPGRHGGHVVVAGDLHQVRECESSLTGAYLSGRRSIDVPGERRPITRRSAERSLRRRRRSPRRAHG